MYAEERQQAIAGLVTRNRRVSVSQAAGSLVGREGGQGIGGHDRGLERERSASRAKMAGILRGSTVLGAGLFVSSAGRCGFLAVGPWRLCG